jgi:hypothetical protein
MFLSEPYPLVEEENTTTILRERFDSSQVRSKSRSSQQTKESNTTAEPQLVAPPPPPLSKDPSPSSDIAGKVLFFPANTLLLCKHFTSLYFFPKLNPRKHISMKHSENVEETIQR